ncbi:hypothetical protein PS1_044109 [Malus domestica]
MDGFGGGSESKSAPEITEMEIRAVMRTWYDEASQEDLGKRRWGLGEKPGETQVSRVLRRRKTKVTVPMRMAT